MKLEIKSGQVNKKRKMAIKEDKQDCLKSNSPLIIDDKVTSLADNQSSLNKSESTSNNDCKLTISLANRESLSATANLMANSNLAKEFDISLNKISSSASLNTSSNILTNVTSSSNNSVNSLLNLSTPISDFSCKTINSLTTTNPSNLNLSTNSLFHSSNSINLNSSSKQTPTTKFSIANILSSVKGAENVLKNKTDSLLTNDLPVDLGNLKFLK